MMKFKWMDIGGVKSIDWISSQLGEVKYNSQAGTGFVLDSVRENYISARFIEKIVQIEQIQDPYGEVIEQESTTFSTCTFSILDSNPGLQISGQTKNIRNFLGALSQATSFEITTSQVMPSIYEWVTRYINSTSLDFYFETIHTGEVRLNDNTVAKHVIKGDKDVLSECKRLCGGRVEKADKIKIKTPSSPLYIIEFSKTGLVSVSQNLPKEEVEKIRKAYT